jgi:hypothetical protein
MASTSIQIEPRNVEREIEVVGRAPFTDLQAAEQWIFGDYAYLSSIDDELRVYDVSIPRAKQVHTLEVDAHHQRRERGPVRAGRGDDSRRCFEPQERDRVPRHRRPSKPRVLSEFTETVSGGVHSAFIDDHYVYLTDDATGSMRIIDFRDPSDRVRWRGGRSKIPRRAPSSPRERTGRLSPPVAISTTFT